MHYYYYFCSQMLNSQSSIAYYFFGWFCLFCFWIIPGNTQALLLVLYSEIISGSAQETRWDSTWVGHMQSKCLTCCAINLGPSITFLFVFRAHPSVFWCYSWFCTQESLLVYLRSYMGYGGQNWHQQWARQVPFSLHYSSDLGSIILRKVFIML